MPEKAYLGLAGIDAANREGSVRIISGRLRRSACVDLCEGGDGGGLESECLIKILCCPKGHLHFRLSEDKLWRALATNQCSLSAAQDLGDRGPPLLRGLVCPSVELLPAGSIFRSFFVEFCVDVELHTQGQFTQRTLANSSRRGLRLFRRDNRICGEVRVICHPGC